VFELAWRGGATEARLHRRRPGGDALPWGTLDLSRYTAAWESGTPELFANVLRDDAILTMPPMAAWFQGPASIIAIVQFIHANMGAIRFIPARTASGPSLAGYLRAPGEQLYRASGIHVLSVENDRVVESHAFLLPHLFPRFGLPETLAP